LDAASLALLARVFDLPPPVDDDDDDATTANPAPAAPPPPLDASASGDDISSGKSTFFDMPRTPPMKPKLFPSSAPAMASPLALWSVGES
jgi:hypothetical protein